MQAIAVEMPTVRVFVNLGVCLRGTNGAKGRRGEIERGEVREKVILQSLENKYADGYARSPLSSCGKALMLRA